MDYPKPTAQIEPFVEVLGADLAVRFLLRFGGAQLYLPKNPGPNNKVADLVGRDKAIALSRIDRQLQTRIPLAKVWMAQYFHSKGMSVAEIARTIRASDVAVRGWLKGDTSKRRISGGDYLDD